MWYKDKDTRRLIIRIFALMTFALVTLFIFKTCSESYHSANITEDQIKIDSLYGAIAYKEQYILQLNLQSEKHIASIDSLQLLVEDIRLSKTKVRTKYEKIYVFVDHATNYELDSIIRSNW